jgi:membrane dipeptidase
VIKTGIVDLHFDLPMHLYARRHRPGVLAAEILPELRTGEISVVVASVYLEERFLPDALHVALDQIALLHGEVEQSNEFSICRSYLEIESAVAAGKIALVLGLEGAEPLGSDIHLLRVFHELGLRVLGLTHARRNAAATGAAFTATGSAADGLTDFGRELVRESERLGIVIDLAHINAAGFDEILRTTTKPPLVSHTNARTFYDIERNISDEQIRAIGARGGLIGINSVLVSPVKEDATVDRYIDHIQHVIDLAGIESVAIGFDFFEFIHRGWSGEERADFHRRFPGVHFVRDLANHADAENLKARLIERGFSEEQIRKILHANAMRFFERCL